MNANQQNTIYRIQDGKGRGPYRGVCNIAYNFDDSQRHPAPHEDSKLLQTAKHLFESWTFGFRFNNNDFIFGFSTLAQLRAWFYKDEPLQILHKNGYELLLLEGACYHGNSQAIINRTTMKVLSRVSLLTLTQSAQ